MHAKISVLQYPATMSGIILGKTGNSWGLIGLSSVLRPLQHSIGYMEDGFYMSKDPTNSINKENRNYTCTHTQNSKTNTA